MKQRLKMISLSSLFFPCEYLTYLCHLLLGMSLFVEAMLQPSITTRVFSVTLLVFLFSAPCVKAVCQNFMPGDVCFGTLNLQVDVGDSCIKTIQTSNPSIAGMPSLWAVIENVLKSFAFPEEATLKCKAAVQNYLCAASFRHCGVHESIPNVPCKETCELLNENCHPLILNSLSGAGINTNCSIIPLVAPTGVCNPGRVEQITTVATEFKPTIEGVMTQISSPRCEPYQGQVCKDVIDYQVYVPSQATQAVLESVVKSVEYLFPILPRDIGCRDAFAKRICTQAFMPCIPAQGMSPPLPRFPCKSECQAYNEICAPAFQLSPALRANCSIRSNAPGGVKNCDGSLLKEPPQDDFPDSVTVFSQDPLIVSLCNDEKLDFELSITCPAPLLIPSNPKAPTLLGGSCAPPCPSVLHSDSRYKSSELLMEILSILSIILAAFMMGTWVCFKEKRNQHIIKWFMVCIFLASLSVILPFFKPSAGNTGRFTSIGCYDETQVDLYLLIKGKASRSKTSQKAKMQKMLYHVYGWGFPAFFTILGLAFRRLGATPGIPWCFLRDEKSAGFAGAGFIFFYWPILLEGFTGIVLMGLIIAIIRDTTKRANKGSKRKPGWWHKYIRPMAFIMTFNIVFIFLFIYRVNEQTRADDYEASAREWIQCLLLEQPSGAKEDCGDGPSLRPSAGLWYLIQFAASGMATIMFVLYGLQQDNFVLWGKVLGMCRSVVVKTAGASTTSPSSAGSEAETTSHRPKSQELKKKDSQKTTKNSQNASKASTTPTNQE